MAIRYPAPLRPGDLVGVTAPSSGVPDELRPRLEAAVRHLQERGYRVRLGECLDGSGVVSAPAGERAAELTALMTDPEVRAVVPPWGGELAVELLPHLDLAALAADPTWLVGYSDLSTLLLALTATTGVASLHGQNLLDTPYAVPEPLLPWTEVLARTETVQGPSARHRLGTHDDWTADPSVDAYAFDTDGTWRLLEGDELHVRGRLLGGCIETVSVLAGTPYGDVPGFAAQHAPEGLLLYVEASEDGALDIARDLWRMRLAGWFDVANALLVGRTTRARQRHVHPARRRAQRRRRPGPAGGAGRRLRPRAAAPRARQRRRGPARPDAAGRRAAAAATPLARPAPRGPRRSGPARPPRRCCGCARGARSWG